MYRICIYHKLYIYVLHSDTTSLTVAVPSACQLSLPTVWNPRVVAQSRATGIGRFVLRERPAPHGRSTKWTRTDLEELRSPQDEVASEDHLPVSSGTTASGTQGQYSEDYVPLYCSAHTMPSLG